MVKEWDIMKNNGKKKRDLTGVGEREKREQVKVVLGDSY